MSISDKISEKKYKKLKESEEKFRMISSNALDAIIQIDEHGVISYWNKAAERIFGYSENKVLGKDLHTLIAPKRYHKSFLKGMELFRKTGKGVVIGTTLEIEGIRKDGTEFPMALSISSIRVNNNWNALAFIRDITERKQAEEKYITIFEHSPIAIELYDSDGFLIKANKACLDLFGVSDIKDIEGFKLFDDPNIPEKEKDLLKDGKIIRYEGKFDFDKIKQLNLYKTTKSGVIYLDVVITPLYIRDKQDISNFLVQIQDITERKKIKQELDNIFTLSLNMIGSAGNDAFFKRINPAVGKTLGYTDEELLSKSFINLIHPDDVESTLKEVETLSEGKSTFNFVNRYRCKDGSYKWIEWNTKPVPEEEITYFVAQDVTARKLIEQKLKDYSRNLENIVEKRTVDIQKEMEKAKMYLNIAAAIIIVLNSDGLIELINRKGYEILDCNDEQLIGINWFDNFIPKKNKDEIKSVFRKLMAGNTELVEYYENPILTRNGIEKIIAWHNTVVKDEQGNIIGILSSGEDITERKEKEEEAQLHSEIMTNMSEGVYLIRLEDLIIVYANPRFEEMFGYNPGEMIGKYVVIVNAPTDKTPEETKNEIVGILKDTGEWHGEVLNVKKDGTPFWCYANVSLFDHPEYGKVIVSVHTDITERRKMMEVLRIKDIVFKASISAQSTADINGIINLVNPAFLKLWGYKSNEEAIGNSVGSFFANPDDTVSVFKALNETGKWEGEFLAKRCDGSTFISQGFASAIYNANGDLIGFQSANLDVTKRREAEEEIAKLARFPSENPNPVLRLTKEKVIYTNKKGEILFNIKEGSEVPAVLQENLNKALDNKKAISTEIALKNLIFSLDFTPISEEGYANVYGRDITERKKLSKILKESEKKYKLLSEELELIIDSIPALIFYKDTKNNFIRVNQYIADAHGMKKEDINGKSLFELYPKDQAQAYWDDDLKVINSRKPKINIEEPWETLKGSRWILASKIPYIDENGNIKGVFGTAIDITDRKIAEEQLKSTMEDLKRSNTELERFAYVASHDLQEPLRMIVSFIQLFEKRYKDKLDEDANDFIAFIVDGAKRMQKLINDLLIYSRIGRKDKQLSHLDINIVIKVVINNLRQTIEETNAKITHDPLPTLTGNEAEFIQLLQNLISNALKFHREDEPPVVHVSAKLKKNQWIFSVRDNGIGIDSQFFDRIFIIFQRLHKKDEFGGTGIGLTICKKIIERHRGKIWVESEIGKGSTFYFSIPKKENDIG